MFIIFHHWLGMIRAAEKLILVCNLWLGSSFAAFTWAHSCRCTQLEFGWRLTSSKTSKIAWCLSLCGLSYSRKLNWASSHGGSHISRAQDPTANAYQASACITFADVPLVKEIPWGRGSHRSIITERYDSLGSILVTNYHIPTSGLNDSYLSHTQNTLVTS